MARVLLYYAHPGHRHSRANLVLQQAAEKISGITRVDLYAEYPRFNIDIEREQDRLIGHDVILFQFPFFWYSTPALVKEWQDLVLEHGFAYGENGDKLSGKLMGLAITAAGSQETYRADGRQGAPITTFLRPLQQTANLCRMRWLPPYVLFGAARQENDQELQNHSQGFIRLLEALRDDQFLFAQCKPDQPLFHDTLPIAENAT